jgi:3-dehydroquinate synthase
VSELSEFHIKTSTGGYKVTVGFGTLAKVMSTDNSIWIVDENVRRLHSNSVPDNSITVHALESEKNLKTVERLLEKIREQNGTRETRVIAVGGGITQDLATFAASSYMRGVRWVYCPTTMLSMVDSCIGGKSSINVGRFKNLAGNFYPPDEVVVDTGFCETLSLTQMIEGLCEASKICYAHSDVSFQTYLALTSAAASKPTSDQLATLIAFCLDTKRHFIEEDEFDQGIRQLLNFGHTFGHAIESATDYQVSHGVAVGLGMLAARRFSVHSGFLDNDRSNVSRLTEYILSLLGGVQELTQTLAKLDPHDAFKSFLSDKKHSADEYTLILFNGEGRLERKKLPRTAAIESRLVDTFKSLIGLSYEIQ